MFFMVVRVLSIFICLPQNTFGQELVTLLCSSRQSFRVRIERDGRVLVGLKGDIIMRIFVTGAPGFIGSALVAELIQAGHHVLGLTRSESGAEALRKAGAEVLYGNIEDLDSLREGAAKTAGVIHLAFNHDFSQMQKNCDDDRNAIEAIGKVLLGSNRPFVVTSGTGIAANVEGKPSTEVGPTASWNPRAASEAAVKQLTARGVNT